MKLVVGLGNPGKDYAWTRHNLGFILLDSLTDGWEKHHKANALVHKIEMNGQAVMLAKPQTFMNSSGDAVASLLQFYKLSPTDLIVVHDDLDLPFGTLRITVDASAGGHNGIKSIISRLGTESFTRLRLGIKTDRKNHVPADAFVLERFGFFEKQKVKRLLGNYHEALSCLLSHDAQTCMNRFN
ncbi:MAG: aminoacyl-tRNA hydrolase [Parcubacteria group bacterium]|nr:aminoacyl-tRNA hydrolase [Parcubacteria group bacterium]